MVKNSRARDSEYENWIGFVSGVAFCALIGIGCSPVLSASHGSLTPVRRYLFAWASGSIGLVGLVVALIPFIAYNWTHALQTEESRESS